MVKEIEIKEFFKFWTRIHESVYYMTTLLEENDLNFSSDKKLSTIGETFIHIANAINGWLEEIIKDGAEHPARISPEKLTVGLIQKRLNQAFTRIEQFLSKCKMEDWTKHYSGTDSEGPYDYTLEWILWHLVEHEIHHRTQLRLHYRELNKIIDDKKFWEATTYGRW